MNEALFEYQKEIQEKAFELADFLKGKSSIQGGDICVLDYDSPLDFDEAIRVITLELFKLINDYEFFIEAEDAQDIKHQCARIFLRISIIIPEVSKYKNLSKEQLNQLQEFRMVQEKRRLSVLKGLQTNDHQYKSVKLLWVGSQRELVELFKVLIKNNWIDKAKLSGDNISLAITEAFSIKKNNKVQSINESSFAKEWRKASVPGEGITSNNYTAQFNELPKTEKVPIDQMEFLTTF